MTEQEKTGRGFRVVLIIAIIIFAFVIVGVADAPTKNPVKKEFWTDLWKNSLDKFKTLSGIQEPSAGEKILGIEIPTAGSFWDFSAHFFIGLIAGLYLYIAFVIQTIYRDLKAKALGERYRQDPLKGIKDSWLEMIASSLWKVFIIAGAYAVITQIPFISRVVQIITFDLFISTFFRKTIVLALELGFLPALIEHFMRKRLEAKYEKRVLQAAKLGASIGRTK